MTNPDDRDPTLEDLAERHIETYIDQETGMVRARPQTFMIIADAISLGHHRAVINNFFKQQWFQDVIGRRVAKAEEIIPQELEKLARYYRLLAETLSKKMTEQTEDEASLDQPSQSQALPA